MDQKRKPILNTNKGNRDPFEKFKQFFGNTNKTKSIKKVNPIKYKNIINI